MAGPKPQREALVLAEESHPWRKAAPVQQAYRTGSAAGLDVEDVDKHAVARLRAGTFARSTRNTVESRWRWWLARCKQRRLDPLPLTTAKLELAGGLLLVGSYRSGAQYLSTMRRRHVKEEFPWSDALALVQKDAARAL